MDSQNTNPPTPAPVPTPDATAGTGKKIPTGLIAGAAILVVVIIAVIVGVMMTSVSKKDYQEALSQYNNVAEVNYTLNSKLSSLQFDLDSSTDTTFNNDVDAAKKAISDVKAQNDKLGKLKAVKVGDGKKKYDAFNTKLTEYTQYTDNLITSLKSVRGAMGACDKVSSSSSSDTVTQINNCADALDKVGTIPDADVKQYVGKLKDEYKNLSQVAAKLAAITDKYGSQYDQYKSLRDQTYAIQDNVRNASKDYQSNLEKHANAVDPKDAARDLAKLLEDNSRK